MTYEQAQRLLDRVREGKTYPSRLVDYALFLTGDFDAYEKVRGPGVVETLSAKGGERWSLGRSDLVGRHYWGH